MVRRQLRKELYYCRIQLHRIQCGILAAHAGMKGNFIPIQLFHIYSSDHRDNILLRYPIFTLFLQEQLMPLKEFFNLLDTTGRYTIIILQGKGAIKKSKIFDFIYIVLYR